MIRAALILLLTLLLPVVGVAQDGFSALARLDPAQSHLRPAGRDGLELELALSQPVPWRVFTLEAPRRLVLDFAELDFARADPRSFLYDGLPVSDLRFGALRPGWSRMVLDLTAPLAVSDAGMRVSPETGAARITLRAQPVPDDVFLARSGAPQDPLWAELAASDPTRAPTPPAGDGPRVVAVDPGHGGIDPGAMRDGVREADIMLALGLELAEAINRQPGMRAVLTRDADLFVPLQARMTRARAAGADVLVSLHADALNLEQVAGASVYVLSDEAADGAAARMAERHERGDLLAGLDLSGQDDRLALVLLELARQETGPASLRLQAQLIAAFGQTGARLTARPARQGELAVLMSTDFPSVLVEAGFLSNAADRAALQSTGGRAPIVAAITRGLRDWFDGEEALAPLRRR